MSPRPWQMTRSRPEAAWNSGPLFWLGAAALVAALVAGGIFRAKYLYRNAFGGLRQVLSSNAGQAAANVEYWLVERRSDAAVAGNNVTELADSPDRLGSARVRARVTSSLESVRARYGYEDAWVVDANGATVAHAGAAGTSLAEAERTAARTVVQSGASVMVGPFRDEHGHATVAFAAPVAGPLARTLGAVILRTDLNVTLLPRLPIELPGSETGQSRLIGRIGDELVVISGSVYPAAAPFSLHEPWDSASPASQLATSGQDSTDLFRDAEGRRVLAAVRHVPGTSWGMVRSIGEAEVLAGYYQHLASELQATLLAGLVLVLLVAITRRSMLARSQRDSAASRALLAEAQALGRMGSWTWDADSGRMTWTPELHRILGYDPDTHEPSLGGLLGAALPDDRPALESAFDALVTNQEAFSLEYRVQQGGGEVRCVRATCRSVPRPGAASPISLGVIADITEQRELEARLVQAQKMQAVGMLAGGIAHDFNNMLTVAIGSCDLLAEECAGNATAMAEVRETRRVCEAAAGLTAQLLAFSRQQVVQTETLDLNAAVRESASLIRRVMREDIEIRTVLCPQLAYVCADASQLQQVLLNLALNAGDAMPAGGTFTLSTALGVNEATGQSYVILTARDTGTGIPPEILTRVFEPFFTTKKRGKGTGLGLSTAHGIVAQFGGELSVETTPGRGSTFIVTLPTVRSAPATGARLARGQCERLDGTETILLVEDDDAVRRGTRRILQHHGYRVLEASDGVGGVRVAATYDGAIDLLLTDAVMPNLAGGEVARQVASLRPGIKVVLMSGYTDDDALRRGISDGRYPFLQKPFDRNELAATVRQTLEQVAVAS